MPSPKHTGARPPAHTQVINVTNSNVKGYNAQRHIPVRAPQSLRYAHIS
jgi:hypothetical protein